MPRFAYTVNAGNGERSTGVVEAASLDAARWALLGRGVKPERLQPASDADDDQIAGRGTRAFLFNPTTWRRIKSVHVELTLRQLEVMLRSGLTLLSSIETIIDQPPSRGVRAVYQQVRQRVESGIPFAEALSEHTCFPKSVTAMVGLGEASGNLEEVLLRCAETMESARRNRTAVLTALFYPSFTFLFAIGVSVYMVLAVIPPMKTALEALGRRLPAMTQSLIDVANFFTDYGAIILVVLLTLGLMLLGFWLWPPGRLALDRFQLRVPLVGTIVRCSGTALFSRLLSTLLNSGIPLVDSLRILTTIHRNRYFVQVVDDTRNLILQGGSLAAGIGKGKAYTPMMVRMVGVGETTGNLEETLLNVAEFHEERLQTLIKQLSAVLEPAIVLIVGLLVGYVYLAFFVALYGAV
ncbi:MAG: type II secretion system F family protein [Verrucomicrobiota bacterium]